MSLLTTSKDIWKISLADQDILAGLNYGIISRAWTYDRMGAQAKGHFGKAIFRISIGRAIQAAFERILASKDIVFDRDVTDYKEEDFWDMKLQNEKSLDIKSVHVFTDYIVKGRNAITRDMIFNSSSGENWETFFPMMIPKDQFDGNPKNYYLFCILSAPASSRYPKTRPNPKFLISIPYSEDKEKNERYKNIHRAGPAKKRVEDGSTYSLKIKKEIVDQSSLFDKPLNLTLGYANENGEAKAVSFILNNKEVVINGLTCFHYLKIDCKSLDKSFGGKILRATFINADEEGNLDWTINGPAFEDIWIYDSEVYFIGWSSKENFSLKKAAYSAYGPSLDWKTNGPHRDGSAMGLLSIKSYCYYYPPVFMGGLKSPAYYCFSKDLNRMDDIFTLF